MDHGLAAGMMKMYFHFGFGDQFLFEGLYIDRAWKMWPICGALFLLTLLYEYIRYIRCVQCGCQLKHCITENGDTQDSGTRSRLSRPCYVGCVRTRGHRLYQTALHLMQTTLGFIIMLSVMSFNLCIIFAILVGKS